MKSIGRCFECKRLMPYKILEQIKFYNYHKIKLDFHHKLICPSCLQKAEEVDE